ncbi:hypothetical protein Y032_0427g1275 [Ancylostoma ceylanicum]|uniref:G-protein coupled receptors family 1 profile domain-containing protein n=4 Tax=Ancylostoma ceylanicum TaxID=53326 RepID=A0A016X070_9BILA|nr:hypothetical protein Y032_0427g1275 [Ancylostoma ceylanicum]
MIMVTNSSKSCEVMESVATSAKLITMLCIHFICSAISIPVLVFTAVKVKKFALLHKNTRSILLVYIFSLAVHSLSRVILYANTLIRFLLPRQSGCDALPSLIGCFFMRLPLNCSMFMVASSTFMIAVERSLSTAKLSNYEENRRIGPILVILQIAFVGCLVYVLYFNTVFSERVIYYCLATTVGSPWFTYVPFSILILLQISAVVILYALKNINKKIATSLREHPDLRARYNVDENLRTITIVFPFCAATCLFTSCFFSLLICVIALNASMDYPTLFTLIDGATCSWIYLTAVG